MMKNIRPYIAVLALLVLALFVVMAGYAQTTTTTQQITLQAQPPIQVSTTTAQAVVTNGVQTYYYWVVANYPVGKALPFVPGVVRNTATPSVGNPVTIRWQLTSGATSYDVIRSTTAQFPPTCNTCAVATGLTVGVATDTNVGLGSYSTTGAASPATGVMKLENALLPETRFTFDKPIQSNKVCFTDGTCQTTAGGGGSGSGLFYFVPASASGTAYTGAVTSFTAYANSTLIFKPDVTNTGAVTVNINALGAKSVIASSGAALTAGQLVGGGLYLIAYDGASFQIVAGTTVVEGAGGGITITYSSGQLQLNTSNLVCLKSAACVYTGAWDASTSSRTSPFKIAAADPGTCVSSVREFFYNTVSNLLKVCNTDNVWTTVTGGGTSQVTLLHQTMGSVVAGTGAAQDLVTYAMPANTLQVGDVLRIEALIERTNGSDAPIIRASLGDGGAPGNSVTLTASQNYYVDFKVTGATAVTVSGYAQYAAFSLLALTGSYVDAVTTFDAAAINNVTLRSVVSYTAGTDVTIWHFRVWRIRI